MDTTLQLSTLVLAVFVGVCLFIVSKHIKVPAIILLLVGGLVLGPEFLGLINPDLLGEGIRLIISLSVAIILFEGGLTLHPDGLKKAPKMIWRLLTFGVVITWFGSTLLIHWLLELSIEMSLLAGSLIIVTGPTVIAPLLKRINVKEKIYHILHWEGVLIDPIGVFIAILCFEWISTEGPFVAHLGHFSYRLLIGGVFGYLGGKAIVYLLQKDVIPEDQSNIFVFAAALLLFGGSEYVVHEAGILAVIVAGLVVGWANPPRLKNIKTFKSELTELAIALVFILLAANLELKNFMDVGWNVIAVLAGVLFVIRPLSVMLCSIRTSLSFNEKLFLSWIAPRGVIAGSMASLFGIELMNRGFEEAIFLETFAFSVIASTIVLQGGTAGLIAQWLKVKEPEKKGWLIIGAHLFSRKIATFIMANTKGVCIFLDTNADAVREAQEHGFIAFNGNALSTETIPRETLASIGNLMALTDNRDLNQLICEKWSGVVDKKRMFRWSSQSPEMEQRIAGMGLQIWSELDKPSQVSYNLKNKESLFHLSENKESLSQQSEHIVLAAENQGKISFEAPQEASDSIHMLWLEKIAKDLTGLLRQQHILFLQSDSYEEALQSILETAYRLYPELPEEQISSMLLERERDFPTTLAHGVAAPHLHCADLSKPFCFIAKISNDIELQTYEGASVQLLFVLLSPESQPELHLRLLAEVAQVTSTPKMVQKLLEAKTENEMIQYLRENKLA